MKVTKSASRRAWCSYLYPSPCGCSGTSRVWRADRSLCASRPGQTQCPQRLDIDLCVNAGGIVPLVPQKLTDLRSQAALRCGKGIVPKLSHRVTPAALCGVVAAVRLSEKTIP